MTWNITDLLPIEIQGSYKLHSFPRLQCNFDCCGGVKMSISLLFTSICPVQAVTSLATNNKSWGKSGRCTSTTSWRQSLVMDSSYRLEKVSTFLGGVNICQ